MAIEVRAVEADEVGKALAPIWHYFGGRPEAEEVQKLGRILPPKRA